jgi:hypothetical protein
VARGGGDMLHSVASLETPRPGICDDGKPGFGKELLKLYD